MLEELLELNNAKYELNREKIDVARQEIRMLLEYLELEIINIPPVSGSMKIVKKEVSK